MLKFRILNFLSNMIENLSLILFIPVMGVTGIFALATSNNNGTYEQVVSESAYVSSLSYKYYSAIASRVFDGSDNYSMLLTLVTMFAPAGMLVAVHSTENKVLKILFSVLAIATSYILCVLFRNIDAV